MQPTKARLTNAGLWTMAAAVLGVALLAASQARGDRGELPEAGGTLAVVVGSYVCRSYTPSHTGVSELTHSLRFSGTGAITPLTGGLLVQNAVPGGTEADCIRFAEELATAAEELGCVASNPTVAGRGPSRTFSLVCEGRSDREVHVIGELSRTLLLQTLGASQ